MAGPLGGIGPLELAIIAGIALVIFGPKNLPKLGKSVGKTVKNVREGMDGKFDEEEANKDKKAEAPAEATPPAPAPTTPPAEAPAAQPEAPAPAAEPTSEAPSSEPPANPSN